VACLTFGGGGFTELATSGKIGPRAEVLTFRGNDSRPATRTSVKVIKRIGHCPNHRDVEVVIRGTMPRDQGYIVITDFDGDIAEFQWPVFIRHNHRPIALGPDEWSRFYIQENAR